ncbi:helix-turn-helix transcriptional regulator [Streptomyces sp. NPDC001089]
MGSGEGGRVRRNTSADGPRLVGRERELLRVTEALRLHPAMVIVEGESGIGKSRLVQEALEVVAATGSRVLLVACPPFREALTLGPVVDAVRQAVRTRTGLAGLELSALAGTLRPHFPEWAHTLPPAPEPLADAGAARHRLISAFTELFGLLGVEILVVEDVHWADEVTLELLLTLASRRPQPFSLVLTFRPEEVAPDSLLLRLSSRLPGHAEVSHVRVTLGVLTVTATAELVSSMLDDEHVSETFAAFLHERTAGVPLVLEECVRLMRDRADVVRRDGEWMRRALHEITVPPTIRDAVVERVARLGPDARKVLLAAAVLGYPADEQLLGRVGGLADDADPAPAAEAAVAQAVRIGLLTESAGHSGRVGFRHALAAQAVYDGARPADRKAAHRRAAAVLEAVRPQPIAKLAHHFRLAGDIARWCVYTERAADVALVSGDHRAALTLLHDLINEPSLPAEAVAPLVRKMPFLAFTDYDRRTEAIDALSDVLEAGQLSATDRAAVRGQLGRVLFCLGDHAAAAAEFELAVPDLGEGTYIDAWAMTVLALPWVGPWPVATHLRWLELAERFAASCELLPHERLTLQVNRMTALLELGEESGWALVSEPAHGVSEPQLAVEHARAALNVGDSALRWGRYEEARTHLTSAVRIAASNGVEVIRIMALVTLLRLDFLTGSGQGLADQARAWSENAEDPVCRLEASLLDTQLAVVAESGGEHLEERLQDIREEGRRRGVIAVWLESAAAHARLRLAAADAEAAIELTEECIRLIADKEMWIWATEIAPVRVAALAALGRHAQADRTVTAFAQGLGARNAPAARAALQECRAICAESRGEAGPAARAWGEAARAWAQLPRPREEERAAGSAALWARAARGSGRRGGRIGYGNRLSPRESDVVRLLLEGKTNRQIAEELSRSPSTVGAQLKSAMRKHGVTTRTALAVIVSRADPD